MESYGPIFDADQFFQNNEKSLVHISRSSLIRMVLHKSYYPFQLSGQVLFIKPLDHNEETPEYKQQDKEWFLWQIILNPVLFDFNYLKKAGYKKDTAITLSFKIREVMFQEDQRSYDALSSMKQITESKSVTIQRPKQQAHCRTQMQFILTKLESNNAEWSLTIGDRTIIGIDGKTTVDLIRLYGATSEEVYEKYRPVNELSSSIVLIGYIREQISHLEVIAETEYEYVGFIHTKTNCLLPDRSTYVRRYFLPKATGLADKQYSDLMVGLKYKYRPTPSIYNLNTRGKLSPKGLKEMKAIIELKDICHRLLINNKGLSELLYAEMRDKGCTHLDACRALYPFHKTKQSRNTKNKRKDVTVNTQARDINLGINVNNWIQHIVIIRIAGNVENLKHLTMNISKNCGTGHPD